MTIISLLYFFGSMLSGCILITQIAKFNRWFRLLIGPGLGLIFTTLVNLLIGLLTGFTEQSITLSFFIVATITVFVFVQKTNRAKPNPKPQFFAQIKQLPSGFSSHWPLVLTLIIIGVISSYIFFFKVLTPFPSGLLTGGGGLYADTAMHAAFTSALVAQGLPPTNPLFAGKLLVYPFLVNFFSASLIKLGMNLRFAFILPQLVYLVGFITLFYVVGKKLTSNGAVFFALLIFFFGWGLGWTAYVTQGMQTGEWKIVKEYTNNLPGYQMHNVLTGIVYPARSFLPGLLIGLLIMYLLLEMSSTKSYNKYQIVTITISLATLPLWHTHTFVFMLLIVGVWLTSALFSSLFKRGTKGELILQQLNNTTIFSSSVYRFLFSLPCREAGFFCFFIILIPIFFYFKQQVSTTSFLKFTPGWTKDAQSNLLLFWFKNTGLLIPLAAIGFWKLAQDKRIWFVPAILMFVIANLVQFQPWDWDNIKLFSWVFLFFSILAGYVLSLIFNSPLPSLTMRGYSSSWKEEIRKNWSLGIIMFLRKSTVLFILFSLTFSGFLSITLSLAQEYTIYDTNGIALAEWVKKNTSVSNVFLIDPWPNHPVSGLSGRSVYMGYPGQLWVHGIDYGKREQQVKEILAGNTKVLDQTEVPIKYIVTTNSQKVKLMQTPRLSIIYENPGFTVFMVK